MKSSCKLSRPGRYLGRTLIVSTLVCVAAWQSGVAQSCTLRDLGGFPGSPNTDSYANAINNRGQVVGYASTASGQSHAFLFEDGVMTDLGTLGPFLGGNLDALGINDRGQVVGLSTAPIGEHAFLYRDGVMTDLGTLGQFSGASSIAYGINNRGQVVGVSDTADRFKHAFLFEDGVMADLGTLPGGNYSYANAINDRGQVVGWSDTAGGEAHAFLFDKGGWST